MHKNDSHSNIISKEDVEHVALLSRLRLEEEEVSRFQRQLSSILDYVAQLDEVDTKDIMPTSHVISSVKNVFRKDELRESLSPEEALGNAPARRDDLFEVPKIIKDA
jgi:aspartyl-tRNA(Asn)/glutamyl-tRNA(Gln) amidotransferase subunit C